VKIERVQRYVMSSLLILVGSMLSLGMVLAALLVIERSRGGAQIGMLVMATVVAAITIAGVRLLNQLNPITLWLLLALTPAIVGGLVLHAR
jgi:hypothetical protein